ncbi:putative glycosidase crf2 [Wickerhamomyces ciferrii]|uniref:Crh-like protein n=1 Tax=Wickerhamomyces ciferrii (strain ATCC 14091 / BCRC 22168 / CBS 111 / JCM 3599 / NBRC 0793 / NRRL Y-1031 F-60-10) TaxID=1206466 RepID=K0KLV2_WICCF|nr:putative glycosidase crf2 [Wickerhamomyces ciferrii]CCH42309.1 putative glycosidase crf2 [Wickerhamomyces ciferrii]
MLLRNILLSAIIAAKAVLADDMIQCNATSTCPEDKPCCSQYGYCGTGKNCLGGCHPSHSFKREVCAPMPICTNFTTDFTDSDKQLKNVEDYLGDPDDTDWVYTGYVADYDDAVLLAMPENSGGTVLSSTRFVWYGNIKARLKTSRDRGVVSAFITFSNIQDEIDFEFVGYELEEAETNYYYQAILNYKNGENSTLSNTFENYHDYEIDWTPEQITWSIDGKEVRTLKKEDTYNETSKTYYYPQTPSRVQVSLWPAGQNTNGVGTIEWAGGLVNWDSEDVKEHGYYYMVLQSMEITCYDPPSGTLVDGDVSYVYNDSKKFDQEYVMITNNGTIIDSQDDTGEDAKKSQSSSSSSSSSSKSDSSSSSKSSSSGKSSKTSSGEATKTSGSNDSTSTSGSDSNGDSNDSGASSSAPGGFIQYSQTSSTKGSEATQSGNSGNSLQQTSLVSLLFGSLMLFI